MPWFICQYTAWPTDMLSDDPVGDYSSFIYARSMRDANKIARIRRLNELVLCKWSRSNRSPYRRPSDQLRRRKLSHKQRFDIIHGLTFLSYILLRSRRAPPEQLVGDEGILHQAIHSLAYGYPSRRGLIPIIRAFEIRAPGYCKESRP